MIENWKSAHKMASNWVFAAIGILGGLEQLLPVLEGMIPPGTYAGLTIVGIVARLWKQKNLPDSEELRRLKTLAKSAGLISLLLVCLGCTEPETAAKRQACLITAEGNSALKAERECIQADLGWYDCPHRERIMSELADAQEKCR